MPACPEGPPTQRMIRGLDGGVGKDAHIFQARRMTGVAAIAVLLSYLAGSVSFPYWVARVRGVDLLAVGSRKLGGSNLWKSVGPGEAIVGGLLDAAKGFVAVVVARAVGLPLDVQLACGIAAIVGQMWPVFHGFDGGRANSAGWGFALAADPIGFVIMMLPVLAAIAMRLAVRPRPSRVLPLASLLSFAVFPAVIWEQDGTTTVVQAGLVVLALIIVRRITAGLGQDLATGAPVARVLANRAL